MRLIIMQCFKLFSGKQTIVRRSTNHGPKQFNHLLQRRSLSMSSCTSYRTIQPWSNNDSNMITPSPSNDHPTKPPGSSLLQLIPGHHPASGTHPSRHRVPIATNVLKLRIVFRLRMENINHNLVNDCSRLVSEMFPGINSSTRGSRPTTRQGRG